MANSSRLSAAAETPEVRAANEEAERQAMRQQYYMDSGGLNDSRRSIGGSNTAWMNRKNINPEVAEIYRRCLALHTQNKINPKNAFELDLIDALPALGETDPSSMDFAYVGKLISVAARIYGCRVDNVCQQTHQLYNEVLRSEGKHGDQEDSVGVEAETEEADEEADQEKQPEKKSKKKAKKVKQATMDIYAQIEDNMDKINLTEEEFGALYDPVYFAAKQFREEMNTDGAFCNSYEVLDDFGRTCVTQFPPEPCEWPEEKSQLCTKRVDRVVAKIGEMECLGSTLSKRFKYNNMNEVESLYELIKNFYRDSNDTGSTTFSALLPSDNVNLDATIVPVQEPVFDAEPDCGLSDDDEFGNEAASMLDYKSAYHTLSKANLQYSYLSPDDLPLFCGPTTWKTTIAKLKAIRSQSDVPKVQKVKKKRCSEPLILRPVSEKEFDKICSIGDEVTILRKEVLDAFNSVQYDVGPEFPYDISVFTKFFSKDAPLVFRPAATGPLDIVRSEEIFVDDSEECDDFAGGDGAVPSFKEGGDGNFGDDALVVHDDVSPAEENDASGDELTGLCGSVILSQQQMPMKTRARRIDVGRVKKVILRLLKKRNNDNQEADVTGDVNDGATSKEDFQPRDFSEIYRVLARQPKLKKEISVQSAFVCLLQMCNEQTLQLLSKRDGDFCVTKA